MATTSPRSRWAVPTWSRANPSPSPVDVALYDTYAGQYQLDRPDAKEKLPITVTKVDNKLMFQAKGQARVQAIPESETRFYLKGPDATVEFVRGPKGAVTHLMLLQDNRYTKAERIESAAALENAPQAAAKPGAQPAVRPEARPAAVPGARP